MSIPKNHHYISQVHIKNFFNNHNNEIYIYDKLNFNIFSKRTTKSIFSEKNLNTKRFIDGNIDYQTIENELNLYFEKDFKKNYLLIQDLIKTQCITEEINQALLYFARYGIIAQKRHPKHKQNTDEIISKSLGHLYEWYSDELKKQYDEFFNFTEEVKYTNTLKYKEIADKILNIMGDLIFVISIPENSNDFFFLPDYGAATTKNKINTYFNPDIKDISFISLPLSSKIYINFYSTKLSNRPLGSYLEFISEEQVNFLNKANFDYCNKFIACESKDYLEKFIKKIA
ncbi:DUF4238 domain-containing protein [Empedobacter sp. UBA1574]|uniref:DUF4238 domain-containing protein n=1 Tax=Empedobacter sp. UBA1574 TaxID=1946429 RepID=UPI0025BA5F0E|nr:DUF4238 domain-containing protein [Empedobacter sp. UBA1574]